MACHLISVKTLSHTILINVGLLLIGPLETYLSEILIKNFNFCISENAFGNIACEMLAILSQPHFVHSL